MNSLDFGNIPRETKVCVLGLLMIVIASDSTEVG